ncbi:hypothetical protein CYMTET_32708, partial [Cymbomonas tetramitiformis]
MTSSLTMGNGGSLKWSDACGTAKAADSGGGGATIRNGQPPHPGHVPGGGNEQKRFTALQIDNPANAAIDGSHAIRDTAAENCATKGRVQEEDAELVSSPESKKPVSVPVTEGWTGTGDPIKELQNTQDLENFVYEVAAERHLQSKSGLSMKMYKTILVQTDQCTPGVNLYELKRTERPLFRVLLSALLLCVAFWAAYFYQVYSLTEDRCTEESGCQTCGMEYYSNASLGNFTDGLKSCEPLPDTSLKVEAGCLRADLPNQWAAVDEIVGEGLSKNIELLKKTTALCSDPTYQPDLPDGELSFCQKEHTDSQSCARSANDFSSDIEEISRSLKNHQTIWPCFTKTSAGLISGINDACVINHTINYDMGVSDEGPVGAAITGYAFKLLYALIATSCALETYVE